MSDRLLSEEDKVAVQTEKQKGWTNHLPDWAIRDSIAEAQCDHAERRERTYVAGWLTGYCSDRNHEYYATRIRRRCSPCMLRLGHALRNGKAPTPSGDWPEGE